MPKRAARFERFPALAIEPAAEAPLYRQVYAALRRGILRGEMLPGARLPSSRALARELGLARHTVEDAYEMLASEGYVRGRIGSGTRVLRALPETYLRHLAEPYLTAYRGDFRRLLRDALYPARISTLVDPEGVALYIFDPN